MTPFIVYALPRSRTFWLSHFLSAGDYKCGHEQAMFMRTVADVRSWLAQDFTGTAETGAAPGWRLIQHYRPGIKVLVVRRPASEVVESVLRLDLTGIGHYERPVLERGIAYLDRMLDQIEAEAANVLSVRFADLEREGVCARIFEHCLPYVHDPERWAFFASMNLQVNSRALMRYRFTHRPQIAAFKSACWRELRRLRGGDDLRRAA